MCGAHGWKKARHGRRHLRPLLCGLCRRLALLFVRPFNVVKWRVTGDPSTPGREEQHSGAAAILRVGPPSEAAGSGGRRRWGGRGFAALAWPLDAALPLRGPWALGRAGLRCPCLAPGCCAASPGALGAGAGGASLPLLGAWMLRCLFRALAGACFQPGSPLPSGCSGSGCVTPETDSYVHGLGVG